jgi:hypothetical protein
METKPPVDSENKMPGWIEWLRRVLLLGGEILGAVWLSIQFLEKYREEPNLVTDALFVTAFVFSVAISYYLIFKNRKLRFWQQIAALIGTLCLLGAALWLKTASITQTDYFILDASQHSDTLLPQVTTKLDLMFNSDYVPNSAKVGVAVFGGEISGGFGCDDVDEFVHPASKEQNRQKIKDLSETLADLQATGPGNIQGAILFALKQLESDPGTPRITLITSGIDNSCGALDRSALDQFAKDHGMRFELVPVFVGPVPETIKEQMKAYANGIFINPQTAADLPAAIHVILNAPRDSSDLYYYGYYGYIPDASNGAP